MRSHDSFYISTCMRFVANKLGWLLILRKTFSTQTSHRLVHFVKVLTLICYLPVIWLFCCMPIIFDIDLTLFRMGEAKRPPTSFSAVNSANVWISPQIFLTFSFNPLPNWCKISIVYLVLVPNYWTWSKTTPQKKRLFWSKPYKVEVMIISLVEML